VRTEYEVSYGTKYIPQVHDDRRTGALSYAELDPTTTSSVQRPELGQGRQLKGEILLVENPFESAPPARYPLPPLTGILASEMFPPESARNGLHPSRALRQRLARVHQPLRLALRAAVLRFCQRSAAREREGHPHITVIPIAMRHPASTAHPLLVTKV